MEAKFKKGDKVVRIKQDWQDVRVGEHFVVSGLGTLTNSITLLGKSRSYDANCFELSKSHIVSSILRDL